MSRAAGTAPILLVEDSEDDVFLMRLAFKRAGVTNALQVATDGEKAVEQLSNGGPPPLFVLLDLNLPKRSGFEVLQWIRGTSALKALPVYILSASNRPTDVQRCLENGANAYLVKPSSLDELTAMVSGLRGFVRFQALPS